MMDCFVSDNECLGPIKCRAFLGLAEELLASQEGFCSIS
jgi:hypothetical protein